MLLLTKEITAKLPPLGSTSEREASEIPVIVKFFDPTGSWSWYAVEGERRDDGDWEFYGFVRGFEAELGSFTLNELLHAKDGLRGFQALPIERDRHFGPHTLAEVMEKRL